MLGKIESGLLYLMRLVMVVMVLFTLFTFVMWGIEAMRPANTNAETAEANQSRDWSAVKINDDELKKTTYADFGYADAEQVKNDGKLAADSAVVAAFADVDRSLRAAINQDPAARQQLEEDNGEAGLAPAQSLPEVVNAMHAKERENAEPLDANEEYKPQPTSIGQALLNQTRSITSSYGYDAGRAFALGAPAAFKTLLADPQVQSGIRQQTASMAVSNLTLNYYMAFSTQATDSDTTDRRHGWLERLLEPTNLLVFTVLLWSFVFMMMIVVFLRVERHLRAMAAAGKAPPEPR